MNLKHILVTCALTIVAVVALVVLVPEIAQAAPSYDWNFRLVDGVNKAVTTEALTGLTRKEALWWCETYQGFGEVSVTKVGSDHNICH